MAITISTTTAGGISAETAGSQALALTAVTLPAGASEPAHLHEDHETALYVLEGTLLVRHGDWLQTRALLHPGEFLYLPPGEVHALSSADPKRPCRALIARTDPHAHESTQPLPELTPLLKAA